MAGVFMPQEDREALNCWEFTRCGREKGCPAYRLNGRRCAQVAGTLCNGEIQGFFAAKIHDCIRCAFYNSEHYDESAR